MKLWEHYYTPKTADEAINLLAQYEGRARVVAGGTDLLVDLRAAVTASPSGDLHVHEALVDITTIPELNKIEDVGDSILIGAGITHTQIVKSPLIQEHAICLVESCGVVGGPQVRNVATLGGNVAHALPAGDGTTSLVVLDAEVEIIKDGSRRWVNILEMFVGTGVSLINPTHDLLLRFRFKKSAMHEATSFARIMRPQGVALPILGCAVWIKLSEDGSHFENARVCIAPVAPTPKRIGVVESVLIGQPATTYTIESAITIAQNSLHPRTSKYRATAAYRHEMIAVLLRQTLHKAIERTQASMQK